MSRARESSEKTISFLNLILEMKRLFPITLDDAFGLYLKRDNFSSLFMGSAVLRDVVIFQHSSFYQFLHIYIIHIYGYNVPPLCMCTDCGASSSLDAFDKEKDTLHPFRVFEKGSSKIGFGALLSSYIMESVLLMIKMLQCGLRDGCNCCTFSSKGGCVAASFDRLFQF
ncbi:hypothetical protein K7X08_035698 [Anisodus acutangulus]|uniref:Uncharacterized protein n=1 Tax=Anisodus acutangulus TaxID=402998 RepID=A0A9Q1LUP5_9SOLA|nr:hypothetical protein K7X08_035698 [Anisodus acutangulus]